MEKNQPQTLSDRMLAFKSCLKVSLLSAAVIAINSCAPVGQMPSAMSPAYSDSNAPNAEAATVKGRKYTGDRGPQVMDQRPGIATGWGDEMKSTVSYSNFKRSSKPSSVSSIYYNDKEGIKAMTNEWRYTGKGMQKSPDGLVEWGVKSGWGYLKNLHSQGKRFVVGSKGSNYSLVVKNLAHTRLELVMSVDGLDILSGRPASLKQRGYVIEPGKTLTIKGFRKSEDAVAAFEFSNVRNSYTNLSQQGTRNIGVMGMAVFTQNGRDPWRYGSTELIQRGGANPFAEAPQLRAR